MTLNHRPIRSRVSFRSTSLCGGQMCEKKPESSSSRSCVTCNRVTPAMHFPSAMMYACDAGSSM